MSDESDNKANNKRFGKQKEVQPQLNYNLPSFLQKKVLVNENTKATHVGFAETIDNERLYYQVFTPERFGSLPKAILLVCHGFGQHVGLFEDVGQRLSNSDYCVVMYDQRGFGRSTGTRGHMKSVQQFIYDLFLVLTKARQDFLSQYYSEEMDVMSDLKIFLYGHHTGALSVLNLTLEICKVNQNGSFDRAAFMKLTNQIEKKKRDEDEEFMFQYISKSIVEYAALISGCISTGSYMKIVFPDWQKKVIRFISRAISTYTISIEIIPEKVTSDEAMQKIMTRDKLRISDLTVKQLTDWEIMTNLLLTESCAKEITLPILMIHGGQDYVADAPTAKRFFELVGSTDKTFEFLFGFMHDLHLEKQREKVFNLMVKWMNSRCKQSEATQVMDEAESKVSEMVQNHRASVFTREKRVVPAAVVEPEFELKYIDVSQLESTDVRVQDSTDLTDQITEAADVSPIGVAPPILTADE